jgi:TRAP-type C4-dicarboxylate transport system substrate-binding protein
MIFAELGAKPIVMDFGEVPTALIKTEFSVMFIRWSRMKI